MPTEDASQLQQQIEDLFEEKPAHYTNGQWELFARFKAALNQESIRAAEPDETAASGWRVNAWVKKGILLGFRIGGIVEMSGQFFDKSTYPLKRIGAAHVTADYPPEALQATLAGYFR